MNSTTKYLLAGMGLVILLLLAFSLGKDQSQPAEPTPTPTRTQTPIPPSQTPDATPTTKTQGAVSNAATQAYELALSGYIPTQYVTPGIGNWLCAQGCITHIEGCDIKGNISASGEMIYHIPGQEYYEQTVIDIQKGERWFCTEEDAIRMGYRKSKI